MVNTDASEKHLCYTATHKCNGLIYVGITNKSLPARKSDHGSQSKQGRKGRFQDALRLYGVEAFEWKVVAEGSKLVMELLERILIYEWDTANPDFGYNMIGGDHPAQIRYQLKKNSWKCFGPPWNKPPYGYEKDGDMLDEYGSFTDAVDNLYDIQGRINIFCADHYQSDFKTEVKSWIGQLQELIQQDKEANNAV
ncbi:MAG: GIY-YIG nuclease family protein [Gammaproteobacteria bacterium]|nr:GIY-YIG nuclease family protein [Gammaproteobacteria bacterium]